MQLPEYDDDDIGVQESIDDEEWKVMDAACLLLMDVA